MNLRFSLRLAAAVCVTILTLALPLAGAAKAPLGVRLLQPAHLSAVDATPLRVEVTGGAPGFLPYTLTISDEDGAVAVPAPGSMVLLDDWGTGVIAVDPHTLAPFALGEALALTLTVGHETVTTEATLLAEPSAPEASTWSIALQQKPAMLYTDHDATLIYNVVNPKTSTKNGVIKVKFLYQKKPGSAWKNATLLQTTTTLSPGENTVSITVPSSTAQQVKNLSVSQEKAVLIVGGIVRNTEQAAVDYDLSATASASPESGVAPLDVDFSADATGGKAPYRFNWDFGDGATSPDQNPTHTYTTTGTFTATVQVVDSAGGAVHSTQEITAHSLLATACSSSKQSGTVPLTVNFTSTPSGGVPPYAYDWDYGDGSQHGTTQNPSHTYTVAGTYNYTVTVTDAIGQTANCGGTINVYPVLTVTATATPPAGTVPLSVAFTSTPLGGKPSYTYDWDYGDGTTHGTEQNPSHIYATVGVYAWKLAVTDSFSTTANTTGTVTVSAIPTYTLTVSIGTGATGTPATSGTYQQGTVVNYSYSALSCYGNLSVLLDGSPVSASGSVTMNANHTLAVSASMLTYTVNFNAGTGGTLSGNTSQTINCGGSTSAVTAVPNSGYTFVNWTGTGGFVTTTTNPLTVTNVTQNMTITANFSAIPTYTLTVSLGTGATGTPATSGTYQQGTVVNYSYSALSCYGNLSVLLDGSPVSASGSVTMNANHTLAVSASMLTYTVNFNAGTGGTLSGSTSQTVNCGGSTSAVTAVPNSGYTFVNWTGTGGFTSTQNPLTVTNVTSNMSITANFSAIPTYTLTVNLGTGATGTPATSGTYQQGTVVNYSYSALSCYGNLQVLLDGSPVSASGSVTMNANHTLTVSASMLTYTVNFNAGMGGTLSGSTSQTINCGGSTTAVTAVPNSGYTFVNWTGTGGFTSTSNPLTITNVTSNMSITANFSAIPTYTLTVSIGTGATGTPATSGSYSQGTVVNYSYSALSCYGNLSVLLDGSPVSASGSVTMNGNHTIAVTASILTYTVNFNAGTGGTLSGSTSQTINCGGSTTAVTAVPNSGYTFVNWTGTGGFTSTQNPLTVTNVTSNMSITANFSAIPTYTLTVNLGTGATGTPAAGTYTYQQGTVVSYSYSASSCYGNLSVLLDGSPVSASGSVTMNGNHTIAVSATLNTYTITASAGANGTISPSGSVVVNCGGLQNFTFTPNSGYIVADVVVDGSSIGHPASYNFGSVTANHTISVSFVAVLTVTCNATPTSGVAPLDVSFTSTPSGGNPASYAYSWTFGDGGTDTTQNPNHNYTSAGNYTATITVSDGLQTAQCSKAITVTAANHPPTITGLTATPNPASGGFPSTITFTLNDTDAGDTISWTASLMESPSAGGSLDATSGGPVTSGTGVTIHYNTNNPCNATVTITATDSHGGTSQQSVSIWVQ